MTTTSLRTERLRQAIRERVSRALPAGERESTGGHGANQTELRRFKRLLHVYPERAGKYLRGQVVYLSATAHGANNDDATLTVAAAIELFQAWVLIHDDIEDDSETRRGLPALHREVGMPIALNVGDALHVRMWRLLLELLPSCPRQAPGIIDEFGAMIELTAEGQHLDLAYLDAGRVDVSEAEYLDMVARKTAQYTVVAPLRLGAMLAGREPDEALTPAGRELGVAFQIRDDVLNLRRRPAADDGYGKEFAGDLYEGKRTLILAHMLAAADAEQRAVAHELLRKERGERTAQDVKVLLDLIEQHGSLEYAQGVAADKANNGLGLLAEALAGVPGWAAAGDLGTLLADVAEREH